MFVADAHCDTLYEIAVVGSAVQKITAERMRAGNVGMQVFAMYAGDNDGQQYARGQAMLRAMRAFPVKLLDGILPDSPPEEPSAVLSIEGGEILEGSIQRLRAFDDEARLRMIGLTWNYENEIGFPALGGTQNGLKPFGFKLLEEMDARGILVDVSHLNEAGFWDVCEKAKLPPIASHSNCRWLCDVPRNLNRDQARAIIERGGFIGINFYSGFLKEDCKATLDDVVRHIDGFMEMGGEKVLGFGSDFDGISRWPVGLETPADFPNLLAELEKRGYTKAQLQDIAGLNLWRTFKHAEKARLNQA